MTQTTTQTAAPLKAPDKKEPELRTLKFDDIDVSHNIRKIEHDDSLKNLAGSIKTVGILEPPIAVEFHAPAGVKHPSGKMFRLVAGFRRVAAAKLAGLKEAQFIVRDMDNAEQREAQLVENLQRQDLDPMDEARAMSEYMALKKASTIELGKRIGKSDDYVRSRINLLRLPEAAVKAIEKGDLTVRHGSAFLKISDDFKAEREAFVKDTLDQVKEAKSYGEAPPTAEDLEHEAIQYAKRLKSDAIEAKKLKAFEFHTCPVDKCSAKDKAELVFGSKALLTCDNGHTWSGITGKPIKERSMTSSSKAFREPKKDKPEVIDRSEPCTLRVSHDAVTIVTTMLKAAGVAGIKEVSFDTGGLYVEFAVMKNLPASSFGFRPLSYTTGEKSSIVANGFDSRQRKTNKAAYVKWAQKALPKIAKSPRQSTKKADAKILEGVTDDVAARLRKIKDLELLEEIRELERKGKARGGVFQIIDGQLEIKAAF